MKVKPPKGFVQETGFPPYLWKNESRTITIDDAIIETPVNQYGKNKQYGMEMWVKGLGWAYYPFDEYEKIRELLDTI